jgi:hypothetical protein
MYKIGYVKGNTEPIKLYSNAYKIITESIKVSKSTEEKQTLKIKDLTIGNIYIDNVKGRK